MSFVNRAETPATPKPSIVIERVMLVVFLGVVSASAWWQGAGTAAVHSVQKFSKTPVADSVADMDFASAESSWSALSIDSPGNLRVDARTHTALIDTVALLHGESFEPTITRIGLLLEKQFGPSASQQIVELLPLLKVYEAVEQQWWEEGGRRNPPAYAQLFRLQDELLGEELAAKLFSEQRRLASLMLASHQIQNDSSLNQTQKQQALINLQSTFRAGELNE